MHRPIGLYNNKKHLYYSLFVAYYVQKRFMNNWFRKEMLWKYKKDVWRSVTFNK